MLLKRITKEAPLICLFLMSKAPFVHCFLSFSKENKRCIMLHLSVKEDYSMIETDWLVTKNCERSVLTLVYLVKRT